ncbi:DJ-1/PfpI family protein [Tabrizicola sp.]|uniref:DJ-1/PfpI family protein n=1 Tax=Tabrizicola sp. TaxID=2005166 RepID=UPI003F300EE8
MTGTRLILISLTVLLTLIGYTALNLSGPVRAATAEEQARTLQLPPPKAGRDKALVVVLAQNSGTETTDFLVPLGILRTSGAAQVISVSTDPGDVALMPALTVRADTTLDAFDTAHPKGADLIIVPAMHDRKNPETLAWLQAQHQSGAVIVSICEGAWLLAHAGLLEGRRATTHWYALPRISRKFPGTTWIRDSRYVVDGEIMTTTGVSASIPATLALVEALAGHKTALATARELGIESWGAAHDTGAFAMPFGMKLTAASNKLGFLGHEKIDLPVVDGTDEVTLALYADAWSRTYRSKARATSPAGLVTSKQGVIFVTRAPSGGLVLGLPPDPATAIDHALTQIETRYGRKTREFVRVQLEH